MDLKKCYDSVLLTYGTDEDRKLGIPGEDLQNVMGARDLVSVYNGLPGYEVIFTPRLQIKKMLPR